MYYTQEGSQALPKQSEMGNFLSLSLRRHKVSCGASLTLLGQISSSSLILPEPLLVQDDFKMIKLF